MAADRPWRPSRLLAKSARVGAVLFCLLLTGCLAELGSPAPSYRAPGAVAAVDRIHVIAEAHAGTGADRFALARLQSFTATELRVSGKFKTVVEGLPGSENNTGNHGGRTAKVVITAYVAGKDVPATEQKFIRGQMHLLESPDIIATYGIEWQASTGPFVNSSARAIEQAFAKQAAKAVLGFE
ncbi:MAG: hypothetical protein HQ511_13645 [Rhodospirillales bacterium]|nr:hypothetical protein [Rhodospirillales bacterium]